MYKDRKEYLEYQRNYYKNKIKKKKSSSFESDCIKENLKIEKRRNYYYNKRYDLLNPPIIQAKNKPELFLII
jgi:hypothetical protein